MQLIYGGKTSKSLPRAKFPESFCLSVNEKHYSNEKESLKFFKEVIIPHLERERERLNLPNQRGLIVMDVFRGQVTDNVLGYLDEHLVLHEKVPANMMHYLQPLDLTVNGASKQFTKKKFGEWYAQQIIEALDKGIPLNDIKIELELSILKQLHARRIVELCDYLTSREGRLIALNGWRRAGILDVIEKAGNGKVELEPLDPFHDIDPLLDIPILTEPANVTAQMFSSKYTTVPVDDESESESEWEDEDGNGLERCEVEDDENEEEDECVIFDI